MARFEHTIPPDQISRYDTHNGHRMARLRPQGARHRRMAFPTAVHDNFGLEKEGPCGEQGV